MLVCLLFVCAPEVKDLKRQRTKHLCVYKLRNGFHTDTPSPTQAGEAQVGSQEGFQVGLHLEGTWGCGGEEEGGEDWIEIQPRWGGDEQEVVCGVCGPLEFLQVQGAALQGGCEK